MSNCTICNDKFTAILRKPIECIYCKHICCLKCLKNDLSNNNDEFKCIFCSKKFEDDFLKITLGVLYFKKLLKKIRKIEYCNICADIFTPVLRQKINCIYCNEVCCFKCFKTYITNKETFFKCMFCRQIFESEFLEDVFDTSFVKKIEEEIIYENEKKNLIFTQRELDLEKNSNDLLKIINNHKNDLDRIPVSHDNGLEYSIKESLITELELKLKNLSFNYAKKCNNTYPVNCIGFLSEENIIDDCYLCSVCNSKSCKNCEFILSNDSIKDHICDTNVLENLKTIKEETKSCPSCFSKIYKSEGCLQMYCVQCFTTFDWNTGKIDTGKIHNPHYVHSFKYYNRDPLDIQCGRELDSKIWHDSVHEYNILVKHDKFKTYFCCVINSSRHINKQIKDYSNEISINRDIRIKYLKGYISKQSFKKDCLLNIKTAKKQQKLLDIIVTFKNCATEIFYRLFDVWENKTTDINNNHIIAIEKELEYLLDLFNNEYNKISHIKKDIKNLAYVPSKF